MISKGTQLPPDILNSVCIWAINTISEHLEKEAALEKIRVTDCLDPLTRTLLDFEDAEDLHRHTAMCPLVDSHLSVCLRMHSRKKTRPHFENSDVSLSHHLVSRKIADIYHHFDYDDSGGPCPVCVCKCVRVSMELNEVCTLLRGLGT
jgi:hypothetical protein